MSTQTLERAARYRSDPPPLQASVFVRMTRLLRDRVGDPANSSGSIDRDELLAAGFSGVDIDLNFARAAAAAGALAVRAAPPAAAFFVDIHDWFDKPARERMVDLKEACPDRDERQAAKVALEREGFYHKPGVGFIVPHQPAPGRH